MARFLSYVLRHHPEVIGIQLDPQGWVDIPTLLEALARHGKPWSRAELEHLVASDDKQRYCIEQDRIRAQQGHSLKVDLELLSLAPPDVLYHGTTWERWPGIQESSGLLPGERHHVHLSRHPQVAAQVGARRKGQQLLVLRVDARAMSQAGHEFFQSGNDVWLTDRVPLEFLQPVGELPSQKDDGRVD